MNIDGKVPGAQSGWRQGGPRWAWIDQTQFAPPPYRATRSHHHRLIKAAEALATMVVRGAPLNRRPRRLWPGCWPCRRILAMPPWLPRLSSSSHRPTVPSTCAGVGACARSVAPLHRPSGLLGGGRQRNADHCEEECEMCEGDRRTTLAVVPLDRPAARPSERINEPLTTFSPTADPVALSPVDWGTAPSRPISGPPRLAGAPVHHGLGDETPPPATRVPAIQGLAELRRGAFPHR